MDNNRSLWYVTIKAMEITEMLSINFMSTNMTDIYNYRTIYFQCCLTRLIGTFNTALQCQFVHQTSC